MQFPTAEGVGDNRPEGRIQPLERPAPLRQQIYERLEDLIIYGALKPGERLVEAQLAARLGVSRVPVREALQMLHRDGWVDLRPRQGAFVHSPTSDEVNEVFSVRTLLEVESARLAAENAREDDLQTLREVLRVGKKTLRSGDDQDLVRANSVFHATIADIGGNAILAQMISQLDKRIRWYFAPVVKARGKDSWKEHGELAEAIAAGNVEGAGEAMRRHAEITRAAYLHR